MRAVIVCGAKIKDYEFAGSFLSEDDYFIYCDSGLIHEDRFLTNADCSADLIIGDFDSHEKPDRETEIIELPREKDDTDSVYAVKEAIKRGFDEVLIVGGVGDRFDHSLVNIYILMYMYERNVKATIVDDYSEMSLIGKREPAYIEAKWPFFSLVAISGTAHNVTIRNAKYNLDKADITPSYQYATSNEVAADIPAYVSLEEGYLLLIKDRY